MNYHAALAHFPKITYGRYKKLVAYFLNLENLWQAEMDELTRAGLEATVGHEFIVWREQNPVEKITEDLINKKIKTVSLGEAAYPRLLSEIADPPHTLFVRGQLPEEGRPAVAVVGTRRCGQYGRQMVEKFAYELAEQGVAIISGLALGIDGLAHDAALKARGITVAVLGSGIDQKNIHPVSHQYLAEQMIAAGGAVISEYPPGFQPTQYSFPARNRIIAGLSLGTLIIEAPRESGALITARCALDYNREVFAIPHPLTSESGEGNNNLIKAGAYLVSAPQDIMEILQIKNIQATVSNNQIIPANPEEAKILSCLSKEPKHIDLITKLTGLPSAVVSSTMVMMEMKGKVKNSGGMTYIIR